MHFRRLLKVFEQLLTGEETAALPSSGVPQPVLVFCSRCSEALLRGFRFWGFGVYGLWFMVYGLWFMVYGLWFTSQALEFKELRVQGCCLGIRHRGVASRGKPRPD